MTSSGSPCSRGRSSLRIWAGIPGGPNTSTTANSKKSTGIATALAKRLSRGHFDPALLEKTAGKEPEPKPDEGLLPDEPDRRFTLNDLWPTIVAYSTNFDPRIVAAVAYQESGFKNYVVHADGTGYGLFGLDDNGLLPDFERWSGILVGRGHNHKSISPTHQIAYAAYQLARYQSAYGDAYSACRAWHRGGGLMNDSRGQNYEALIRQHVKTLFG